ncbi:hypothetical protein [Spirosoma fluminis]
MTKFITPVRLFCLLAIAMSVAQPLLTSVELTAAAFTRNTTGFYWNSVLLNGQLLDESNFSMQSRGTLVVVAGDPVSYGAERIPFRIYLRRAGSIIHHGQSDPTRDVYTADVSQVLAFAVPGDELIIEPSRQSNALMKRSIHVKTNWPLPMNWLFSANGRGC